MLEVSIASRVFRRPDGSQLQAVGALDFALDTGSFTCITGPSGCGKTTTLRMILGLDTNFDGRIAWHDARGGISDLPRVAAVFQEPRLLPWRSVEDNVRLALPDDECQKPLDALFDELELTSVRDFYPAELSLGMARRVALARAFALEPALLILDEPFVSLDEPTAERLRGMLMTLWQARPTTTLMVTHNVHEAAQLADQVLVFSARPGVVQAVIPVPLARAQRDAAALERLVGAIRSAA